MIAATLRSRIVYRLDNNKATKTIYFKNMYRAVSIWQAEDFNLEITFSQEFVEIIEAARER